MAESSDIETPPAQQRQELNSRMRALLEAPPFEPEPNSDNHHATLMIDGYKDDYNYVIEAYLYNSAKQDEGFAFLNVLEQVSKSKKMSISAIFNSVSLSGDTLLHIAAQYGNAEIVKLIIHHFPSLLNKENQKGDTAVHSAAKAGKALVLQVIKVAWTDDSLQVKNKQGNTPLHEALINRHENLADELVKEDVSVSFVRNVEDKSAFYLAAEAGYMNCLQLMMEYVEREGIDLRNVGKSPIQAALWGKHKGSLDIMLEKQPGLINSRDEKGRTSLHFAAWMGYNDAVDYLIKKNSRNIIKRDKDGQLPIHLATMMGHIDVIEQLLKQHYNPHELLDDNGQNILHVAAECGKYEVVIYVLKHPQELNQLINQKDNDGNTPLHLATMKSNPKIVNALARDERVDLHSSNNKSLTALDAIESNIDGMPTFQQWLTWLSLKASGASHFSSAKILLNLERRSKTPNIDNNTDKPQPPSSSVDLKKHNIDSFKIEVNTLLLVSTLIATVTFAAGFTMPGGYNNSSPVTFAAGFTMPGGYNNSSPDEGIATMIKQGAFQLFVFCDTLAMFTSLAVVVLLIWSQLDENSLKIKVLEWALPLLGIALTMMCYAFMAGVLVTVRTLTWLAYSFYVMALVLLIPVYLLFTTFSLYFPFTSSHPVFRYITFYLISVLAP